jgi:hypothetical protein
MGQLAAPGSLMDRRIRAARLDIPLYNEVDAETNATSQALTVVVRIAVASGIGSAIGALMAGREGVAVGGLVAGIVRELLGWAVWSYIMFFVGTRPFHGTATDGELLPALGFAYSPGVLQFIPVLGSIIALVVGIWRIIITGFIAVREALEIDTGNTIATIIVGIIAYIVVMVIVAAINGALGLGAAAVTGAFRSLNSQRAQVACRSPRLRSEARTPGDLGRRSSRGVGLPEAASLRAKAARGVASVVCYDVAHASNRRP